MDIIITIPYKEKDIFEKVIKKAKQYQIKYFRFNISKISKNSEYCSLVKSVKTLRTYINDATIIFDLPYPQQRPRLYMEDFCYKRVKGEYICYENNIQESGNRVNIQDCRMYFTHNYDYISGDGNGILQAIDVKKESVTFICMNDFIQYSGKAITSDVLIKDIDTGGIDKYVTLIKENNPNQIWFSFVEDIGVIKSFLSKVQGLYDIYLKIETEKGINNLEQLLEYNIIVARGDLGISIEAYKMKDVQNYLVKKSKEYGKRVIIGTDILLSMFSQRIPTRAEMIDLCNIMEMNVDGIMLNAGSVMSIYFEDIINNIKKCQNYYENN